MDHPLDDLAWRALTGPLAGLALRHGRAVRARPDVSPFGALAPGTDAWVDLAALGPEEVVFAGEMPSPPRDWVLVGSDAGVQLVGDGLAVAPDPDAVVLGSADVPAMLDLVGRTRPGPFGTGTIRLGTYLGLRDEQGALVAMAGERFRVPGWTEISAVCTDPAHRGRGLATRLVRAVGALIRARGDVPFLHTAAVNTVARSLYASLGFTLRTELQFSLLRPPPR